MALNLPKELKSWASLVEGLPEPLALTLVPLAQEIRGFFGGFRVRTPAARGDLVGVSGLSRVGAPQSMIMEHLAMAFEAPDAFLQRAADNELLYTALEFEEQRSGKRCTVIACAGPSQQGQPRLLQLAVLLALSERAASARVAFEVRFFGSDEVVTRMDSFALTCWQQAKNSGEPTAEELYQVVNALELSEDDEVWILGGPSLVKGPQIKRVQITETLSIGGDLRVEFVDEGRCLVLPPLASKVSKGAYRTVISQQSVAPRGSISGLPQGFSGGKIWFDPSGNRLLCPYEGGVAAVHVPNSRAAVVNSMPGYTKLLLHSRVLWVGFQGKRFVYARQIKDQWLELHSGAQIKLSGADLSFSEVRSCFSHYRNLHCVDASHQLWKLPLQNPRPVLDVEFIDHRYLVTNTDGERVVSSFGKNARRNVGIMPAGQIVSGHVLCTVVRTPHSQVLTALVDGNTNQLILKPTHTVVGTFYKTVVLPNKLWNVELGAVVTDTKGSIHYCTAEGVIEISKVPDLSSVAVHPTRSIVAWRTAQGELYAYCLTARQLLLSLRSEP